MRYDYIFLEFSLHLKMKNYVLQDEFRTVTVDQLFFWKYGDERENYKREFFCITQLACLCQFNIMLDKLFIDLPTSFIAWTI